MKGKVAYMSPEQCLGMDVDRRSDIFCLGIVLYELVTVRRLFKGANDFLTMAAITHGVIPRPSEVRPELPAELEEIILKALQYKPEDRYQTANEMRAALERFAQNARLQTSVTALADFMRAEFGERDVPWMEQEDEPEVSIDFDGSGNGIVAAPEAAVQAQVARGGRPMRRTSLLRIAARGSEPVLPSGVPGVGDASAVPTQQSKSTTERISSPYMQAASPYVQTDSSYMQVASSPFATSIGAMKQAPAHRRRRVVYIAAAAGAVAVIATVALVLMGGSSSKAVPASSVSAPVAAPQPPAPQPVAEPAPVTPPNMVPSAPSADDPQQAQTTPPASGAAGSAPTEATPTEKKPARPTAKRPAVKKPAPKGVWDPKALLPPK